MRRLLLALSGLGLLLVNVSANAFFDEIDELKAELTNWQETNAEAYSAEFSADFTDVVARLDEMSEPTFADVKEDTWFFPYVSSVAEWGIVSGYKDASGNPTGEYQPGNPVTIAEALKMAYEAAAVDESQCKRPVQHPAGRSHWAMLYISCAEEGSMRLFQQAVLPDLDRPARRAEVLSIIHDAFRDIVPPLYATQFTDVAGHPLESDVALAAARGIIAGDKNADGSLTGKIRPNDQINRAEVAKMIYQRLRAEVREEGV